MLRNYKFSALIFGSFLLFSCNQKTQNEHKNESILKGSVSIFVDETLTPIIDDQVAVFESYYDAKIKVLSKSEVETVNSLFNEKAAVAILTRDLTVAELAIFEQRKIIPKRTKFAIDAIALISNKKSKDSVVALKQVLDFMQGKAANKIKGLVFDNLNSSTVRYMNALAGITAVPKKGVFSFNTNEEVIKYVAENDGMIGIVGVNWLFQPQPEMQQYIDKITILGVNSLTNEKYYTPSQNNIAEGKYPLARELFIINCQGYSGLGMGFASFVAGDIGQRIILKSSLLPVRIPTRNITITKKAATIKK